MAPLRPRFGTLQMVQAPPSADRRGVQRPRVLAEPRHPSATAPGYWACMQPAHQPRERAPTPRRMSHAPYPLIHIHATTQGSARPAALLHRSVQEARRGGQPRASARTTTAAAAPPKAPAKLQSQESGVGLAADEGRKDGVRAAPQEVLLHRGAQHRDGLLGPRAPVSRVESSIS